MCHKKMCTVHEAAMCLLFVGGINWLLVGLAGDDLFSMLGLGMGHAVSRVVYVLVGVSALLMLAQKKCCGKCSEKGCGAGGCQGGCGPKDAGKPAA